MMRRVIAAVTLVAGLTAAGAGPDPATTNMDILRQKVKADKKLVVAENLTLTDAEGDRSSGRCYDAYQKDLQQINQRLAAAILAYADAYNKGPSPTRRRRSCSRRRWRLTMPRRS